jgi:hypothetical protein
MPAPVVVPTKTFEILNLPQYHTRHHNGRRFRNIWGLTQILTPRVLTLRAATSGIVLWTLPRGCFEKASAVRKKVNCLQLLP